MSEVILAYVYAVADFNDCGAAAHPGRPTNHTLRTAMEFRELRSERAGVEEGKEGRKAGRRQEAVREE